MDENKTWNPLCYSVLMYKHWCFGRSTPMTPPPLLFCANPWLPPNTSHESRLATRLWSCKWLKPVYPSIRHPVQQFVMVTGQGSCMQIECVPAKAINGWDERLRKERGEHETFVYNKDYGTCAKAHTFTIKSQEFICWGCPNNLAGPEQPSSLNESFVCSTSRHLHASPSFACLNCGSMNSSDVAKRSSWQDPFPVGLRKPTQDLCKLRQMCTFQQSNVPSESITLTGEKIL